MAETKPIPLNVSQNSAPGLGSSAPAGETAPDSASSVVVVLGPTESALICCRLCKRCCKSSPVRTVCTVSLWIVAVAVPLFGPATIAALAFGLPFGPVLVLTFWFCGIIVSLVPVGLMLLSNRDPTTDWQFCGIYSCVVISNAVASPTIVFTVLRDAFFESEEADVPLLAILVDVVGAALLMSLIVIVKACCKGVVVLCRQVYHEERAKVVTAMVAANKVAAEGAATLETIKIEPEK